ncbi:MAG: RNA polymerase factor sigma-32 [Myxococcota bacterium]|nr:RNA polymerase factor sigma-32 [Myxococcota bacterium]
MSSAPDQPTNDDLVLEPDAVLPAPSEQDRENELEAELDSEATELAGASAAHGGDGAGEVIDVVGSTLPVAASSTGLAARDPLQAYMQEISRYSLLTPEEEHELAVRYQDQGDAKAAYKLVTANLRLVAKIAFKYRRFYKNVLDLIQEGNIGLMKAVQKFDPYRGVRLSTYARYWIQAYVMYFLLANHRIVKVGTTQAKRKLFYNLTKETKRLRDMGFDPTPQRIAESLDVDVKDVIEMKHRLASPDASLDAPIGDESSRTLGASLPSPDLGPEAPIEHAQMMSLVSGAMRAFGDTLTNEREITIWADRLMAEDPRTLEQIGTEFGVTRERARQIEAALKAKLRTYLLDKLGTEVELSVELL